MDLLISEARISVADAAGVAGRMVDLLTRYEISFESRDGQIVAKLPFGTSALSVEADTIKVRVEAPT